MRYKTVSVDLTLEDFEDDELIEELQDRHIYFELSETLDYIRTHEWSLQAWEELMDAISIAKKPVGAK